MDTQKPEISSSLIEKSILTIADIETGITVTLQFSKDIPSIGNITINKGSISNITNNGNLAEWTFLVKPNNNETLHTNIVIENYTDVQFFIDFDRKPSSIF